MSTQTITSSPAIPKLNPLKRSRSQIEESRKPQIEVSYPPSSSTSTKPLLGRASTWNDNGETKAIRLTTDENHMIKTTKKAAEDHRINPSLLSIDKIQMPTQPLILHTCSTSKKGKRPANEDHHITFQAPFGNFFAVFDGHGTFDPEKFKIGEDQIGKEISKLAAQLMEDRLPSIVYHSNYNVRAAFTKWCRDCQSSLPKVFAGTTAVFCFFEKVTHYLYTGTVGDSEAVLFRKENGVISAIPLSPKINWRTPEAEKRVQAILTSEEFKKWTSVKNPKTRRFPPETGINVSSSLGDKYMQIEGKTAIRSDPEIGFIQVKKDDRIIIACDGIWDYVSYKELIGEVLEPKWNDPQADLAELIAHLAYEKQHIKTNGFEGKNLGDNMTVIAVRVSDSTQKTEEEELSTTEEDSPPTPLLPSNSSHEGAYQQGNTPMTGV